MSFASALTIFHQTVPSASMCKLLTLYCYCCALPIMKLQRPFSAVTTECKFLVVIPRNLHAVLSLFSNKQKIGAFLVSRTASCGRPNCLCVLGRDDALREVEEGLFPEATAVLRAGVGLNLLRSSSFEVLSPFFKLPVDPQCLSRHRASSSLKTYGCNALRCRLQVAIGPNAMWSVRDILHNAALVWVKNFRMLLNTFLAVALRVNRRSSWSWCD